MCRITSRRSATRWKAEQPLVAEVERVAAEIPHARSAGNGDGQNQLLVVLVLANLHEEFLLFFVEVQRKQPFEPLRAVHHLVPLGEFLRFRARLGNRLGKFRTAFCRGVLCESAARCKRSGEHGAEHAQTQSPHREKLMGSHKARLLLIGVRNGVAMSLNLRLREVNLPGANYYPGTKEDHAHCKTDCQSVLQSATA